MFDQRMMVVIYNYISNMRSTCESNRTLLSTISFNGMKSDKSENMIGKAMVCLLVCLIRRLDSISFDDVVSLASDIIIERFIEFVRLACYTLPINLSLPRFQFSSSSFILLKFIVPFCFALCIHHINHSLWRPTKNLSLKTKNETVFVLHGMFGHRRV
jgi:hypothetical protein